MPSPTSLANSVRNKRKKARGTNNNTRRLARLSTTLQMAAKEIEKQRFLRYGTLTASLRKLADSARNKSKRSRK